MCHLTWAELEDKVIYQPVSLGQLLKESPPLGIARVILGEEVLEMLIT
jgi:hypothetical protein